ncbi:MAG TPA: universal stress protein [Bryobacteraceae bacterium]|nr:universal stress protein [Bryobacteraceae bacterium]
MKILLAVDSSVASDVAVNQVVGRPWPPDTIVHVLTVLEPSHLWNAAGVAQGLERSAEELVQFAARRLCSAGIESKQLVLPGDPKSVIVDQAEGLAADLVMLGSHGVTGLTRFLLGSVAANVARFAPCSVEIVRAATRTQLTPGGMKILVATDGSECSEIAARSIAERPWPTGTEVRVLSVVELSVPLFRAPVPPYFDPHAMEELRGAAMKKTEEAVMAAEQIMLNGGLQASGTEAVPSASPKELILNEAVEWGADLIVVGSHGRKGVSRFLLGSVSEAVAAHASCSVEVIRQRRA